MEKPLVDKLSDWFQKTGYPLEVEAAKAFLSEKFDVYHSMFYPDPQTRESREIDVVAWLEDGSGAFSVVFPIECKATDKPWVVLTSPEHYSRYTFCLSEMTQKASEAVVPHFEEFKQIYHDCFGGNSGGYGLKQAFSEKTVDHAYAASMSALKAANSLVSEYPENRIVFAFPTIVVNSPIFEFSQGPLGEPTFKEVESSGFLLNAHFDTFTRAYMRIVSNKALGAYAGKCRVLAEQYRALFYRETKAVLRNIPQ